MQLFEYRSRLTGKEWEAFCKKLGCSPHYLYQIAKGADKVSKGADKDYVRLAGTKLCIRIEELTKTRDASSRKYKGVVFRWDLRPDYWPAPKKEGK